MTRRRYIFLTGLFGAVVVTGTATASAADDTACAEPQSALGVERVVEIDTSAGPLYGQYSVLSKEESFLGPKEVVLTFDDGPIPWITKSILDTLDSYCTKATFFSVGRMAVAYPATIKDVMARGHTLGTHTWSHPLNLKRLSAGSAIDQIERGFAAVAMAAGQPIAPFFRFPGLSDSDPLMAHLQSRGIGAFTVDVISNDSYISDAKRLVRHTLNELEQRQGGIILFHDIKAATAKALPEFLRELKARDYKVVHMRAKTPITPLADYDAQLKPVMDKVAADQAAPSNLMPFFGTPAVLKTLAGQDVEVATLTPAPRPRSSAPPPPSRSERAAKRAGVRDDFANENDQDRQRPKYKARVGGWTAQTKSQRAPQPKPSWSPGLFGF